MGKSKSVTVGYTYYMAFHMGVARACNSLVQIRVGDKEAWKGNVTENTTIDIDKPDLFGGKKAEGGVKGPAEIMFGDDDQVASPALKKMLSGSEDGRVPGFRGFMSVFFDGMFAQMNPYPKRWAFRVRRSTAGWSRGAWYSSKAVILLGDIDKEDPDQVESLQAIHAMNPAHIILYAFTEPFVGRGLPREALDLDTFREAADRLYEEGFGLCITWTREESVGDFIQMVLDHIGGATFQDRKTGLIKLKLIRDDYDPNDLPVYTVNTGILSISQAEVAAQPAVVSEVIVNYTDPVSNSKGSVRSHNLAVLQDSGAVYSTTIDYLGLPTSKLANQVAQRELKARSVGLRRFSITMDRRGYDLEPAGVFRLTDESRGISNMVLRIADYEDGTMTDNTITINAVQDVFSFQLSAFTDAQPDEHIPVDMRPQLARRVVYEVPYIDLLNQMSADEFERLTPESGFLGAGAEQPSGTHMGYEIHTQREGESTFSNEGTGDFIPLCELSQPVDYLDTEMPVEGTIYAEDMVPGQALMIGDEIVVIQAIEFPGLDEDETPSDGDAAILTVQRGAADTIPHQHSAGDVIWFYQDDIGTDEHEYIEGETVQAKILPWTLLGGTFPEGSAPTDVLTFNARYTRPYPPGRVLLDGEPWYVSTDVEVEAPMVLEWAHRDRPGQADRLVGHEEGDIGPEPGTRYHITVRNESGDVIKELADITGTRWEYTVEEALDDFGVEMTNEEIRRTAYMNLETIRTAENDEVYGSWQSYDFSATFILRKFWMQVASMGRAIAIADSEADLDGVYVAQLARSIAEEDPLPSLDGLYVSNLLRNVAQRTTFGETPKRKVMERPYLLQLRAGASLLSHNVTAVAAQPLDMIPDWYTLYTAINPNGMKADGSFPDAPSDMGLYVEDDPEQVWGRWAKLSAPTSFLDTELAIAETSASVNLPMAGLPAGTLIVVDREIMAITAATETSLTVKRGVADTIPAKHSSGSEVWALQVTPTSRMAVSRNYATDSVVAVKYINQQFAGPVDFESVATDQVLIKDRVSRPYPPGQVLVNGEPWYSGARISTEDDTITVTWVDRNRVTQATTAVGHGEGAIPRESGSQYRVQIVKTALGATSPTVLYEATVDGNTWSIDYETARPIGYRAASMGGTCGGGGVIFELYTIKGELLSWMPYQIRMTFPAPVCTGSNGVPIGDWHSGGGSSGGSGGSSGGSSGGGGGGGGSSPDPTGPDPVEDNNEPEVDPEQDPEPEDENDPNPNPGDGPQGGDWSRDWGNKWGADPEGSWTPLPDPDSDTED